MGMCNIYLKKNIFGLIHRDLHFDNFMFDGTNLHLLDFERCMVAPIDYEFRIFSKYDTQPYLWASAKTDMLAVESDYQLWASAKTDMLAATYDYQDLIEMFLENYEELNNIPYINERLEFYSLIELLENYKNTKNSERMQEVREKVKRLKLVK